MERVSVINGTAPFVIVVPHGFDDERTEIIGETAAKEASASAVINRGWQRSDHVDQVNDLADCNNTNHLNEDVVKEEFLEPIIQRMNRIHPQLPHQIIIHGCGNQIRKTLADPSVAVALGFGAGDKDRKPRLTCTEENRHALQYAMFEQGINSCNATSPRYAGWSRRNLNQFWRRQYSSYQLEIVRDWRTSDERAEEFGTALGKALVNFGQYVKVASSPAWDDPANQPPLPFPPDWRDYVKNLPDV